MAGCVSSPAASPAFVVPAGRAPVSAVRNDAPRFLKNGVSASATSVGSWNRWARSLAIILATRAASSVGTSVRTSLSSVASVD